MMGYPTLTLLERAAKIRKSIDRICSIYKTVGDVMYDEVRERLTLEILSLETQNAQAIPTRNTAPGTFGATVQAIQPNREADRSGE